MAYSSRDLVFISYSHVDKKWLRDLRTYLKPYERKGLEVWADDYIRVGDRWERGIDDALARTCVGVLLVSQDFLASDFIYEEEIPPLLAAADRDDLTLVCVPVSFTTPADQLNLYQWVLDPKEPLKSLRGSRRDQALVMVAMGIVEAAARCEQVQEPARTDRQVRTAAALSIPRRGSVLAMLHDVPNQRPHFVSRPEELSRLKQHLLKTTGQNVGITGAARATCTRIGVQGMGGIGKTVLAIETANDEEVRRAFPDGVFWVELGQEPALESLQVRLLEQLGRKSPSVESPWDGRDQLVDLFSGKKSLLIVDDVWRYDHARAFDVVSDESRLLTTTRDSAVLTGLGAEELNLEVMEPEPARRLLAEWSGIRADALPPEADAIVRSCGRLPLALAVAGARIRDGLAWGDLATALEQGLLDFLDHPYANVFNSLRLSVAALGEDDRARYLELAVFPEDVAIPRCTVERYWAHTTGLALLQSHDLLVRLQGKGLLFLEAPGDGVGSEAAYIRFHDLQRDWLQLAADDLPALHRQFLDAHVNVSGPELWHWSRLPNEEPYLWIHLAHHLIEAGQGSELRELLCDFRWLDSKLRATTLSDLLDDFESAPETRGLRLIAHALRLSANLLAQDPRQLASQLLGRLQPPTLETGAASKNADSVPVEIRRLLDSTNAHHVLGVELRPVRGSLTPPGGSLQRTLEGHQDGINSVGLTSDGCRAVSASKDKTLKVWDLETGRNLNTLAGHLGEVTGVRLSQDGRRAVSTSKDKTLRVWDLEAGRCLHILEGHLDEITGMSLTKDDRRAVSGSEDGTLRVWDLESGETVYVLEGEKSIWQDRKKGVAAVCLTEDDHCAVSVGEHDLPHVWDLRTGRLLRTLECNDWVQAQRKKKWKRMEELKEGNHIHGFPEMMERLELEEALRGLLSDKEREELESGLDLSRRLDEEGKPMLDEMWMNSPHLFGEFPDGLIDEVIVTVAGARAVSVSRKGILHVWDLETAQMVLAIEGSGHWVNELRVIEGGKRAISASSDGTLVLWDLETGQSLLTLKGHQGAVTAVSLTRSGKRAVSASADRTLRVWDLKTGRSLHTLAGHQGKVNAVSLTPEGRRAVSASDDGTLRVWDLEAGSPLHSLGGHQGEVRELGLTADGQRLVSASADRTLRVWESGTGRSLRTLKGHREPVNSVSLTGDGRWAVSASADATLRVWDLKRGRSLRTFEEHRLTLMRFHTGGVTSVRVTRDGRHAVSASVDGLVLVWGLRTGRTLHRLKGHWGRVNAIGLAANGGSIVSASDDGTIRVWNLQTGQLVYALKGHQDRVLAIALSKDDRLMVSASQDGTLRVWDLEAGHWLNTLEGHEGAVTAVSLSGNGKRAVSASADLTLRVWNPEKGKLLRTLEGHQSVVNRVCLTRDGRWAVSSADDCTLRLWDLETGQALACFTADASVRALACSADGRLVVAGDMLGRLHILNIAESKAI